MLSNETLEYILSFLLNRIASATEHAYISEYQAKYYIQLLTIAENLHRQKLQLLTPVLKPVHSATD